MSGKVVHCKRESYDVYIGRPSKWGNPFTIGPDGDRDAVIAKYTLWIGTQPDLITALPELRGKTLGCWCAPKACHGDVLLALTENDLRDLFPARPCKHCDEPITPYTAREHIREKHPGHYAELASKVAALKRELLGGRACFECGGTGWSAAHFDAFPCPSCDGSGQQP